MGRRISAEIRHGFRVRRGNGKVEELPQPEVKRTEVFPGLELPFQTKRYFYEVANLPMDTQLEVLGQDSHDTNEVIAWDNHKVTGAFQTTNIRIAKILKRRGFTVEIKSQVVALVYSEVMAELQKMSYDTFKKFVKLVDNKITFKFRDVPITAALQAVEKSKAIPHNREQVAMTLKDGVFSCKSLRTVLELVNLTAQLPTAEIETKGHAFA